jgi:polysaccharide export outer membrane protein
MFHLKISRRVSIPASLIVICFAVAAQVPQAQTGTAGQVQQNPNQGQLTTVRSDYTLGPNDQVLIRSPQSEEINEKPFRIDTQGFLSLPVVGRVRAEGLTVQALEADLAKRLSEYIREPLVSITVTQFRSEPVFFMGAFKAPGIYPLQGRRTLVEMLAAVGGLLPNASRRIRITRHAEAGPIPLPNAIEDPEKKTSTVSISFQSLTENINPAEDIILRPYDIVAVERAERVYVSGEVGKVSSIELGERDSISVAQALTEAGGFTLNANRNNVRVLRKILGTNRRAEFDIDLKRVFEGKDIDFPLLPNDVLFVPRSSKRTIAAAAGTSFLAAIPVIIVTALLR